VEQRVAKEALAVELARFSAGSADGRVLKFRLVSAFCGQRPWIFGASSGQKPGAHGHIADSGTAR
jgi:hypothetical protein